MMTEAIQTEQLSRGVWTLAHYLVERSPVPMPQIVGLRDNVLEVAKIAVTFPIPRTSYVANEAGELQGMITADRLAAAIFELIESAHVALPDDSFFKHSLV